MFRLHISMVSSISSNSSNHHLQLPRYQTHHHHPLLLRPCPTFFLFPTPPYRRLLPSNGNSIDVDTSKTNMSTLLHNRYCCLHTNIHALSFHPLSSSAFLPPFSPPLLPFTPYAVFHHHDSKPCILKTQHKHHARIYTALNHVTARPFPIWSGARKRTILTTFFVT
jgi:hypothetical protein